MQPGSYDITIQQGADYSQTFQLKDSDGDAFNLTGSTIQSEIWLGNKRAKLADFTVTIIDAALGKFSLNLTKQQTANLLQSAYYDILVTDVLGASNYWVRGKANLETGYTE